MNIPPESKLENRLRNYTVHFGKVKVFQSYTKTVVCTHFTVKNDVICNIKQHPDTCKIHNMFTVSSPCSDVRIPAHKHLEFIVTYKPIIPNYRSLEIYEYTDSDLNSFYIILKGEAI
ncbi:hypothetical protein GWI33_001870, partial [Rhynchophorus ferrugineus]